MAWTTRTGTVISRNPARWSAWKIERHIPVVAIGEADTAQAPKPAPTA